MDSLSTTALTPLQRRQLARFTDWQRPAWVAQTNPSVKPFLDAGLLVGRLASASHGAVVWEYRLTAAGTELLERTTDVD